MSSTTLVLIVGGGQEWDSPQGQYIPPLHEQPADVTFAIVDPDPAIPPDGLQAKLQSLGRTDNKFFPMPFEQFAATTTLDTFRRILVLLVTEQATQTYPTLLTSSPYLAVHRSHDWHYPDDEMRRVLELDFTSPTVLGNARAWFEWKVQLDALINLAYGGSITSKAGLEAAVDAIGPVLSTMKTLLAIPSVLTDMYKEKEENEVQEIMSKFYNFYSYAQRRQKEVSEGKKTLDEVLAMTARHFSGGDASFMLELVQTDITPMMKKLEDLRSLMRDMSRAAMLESRLAYIESFLTKTFP